MKSGLDASVFPQDSYRSMRNGHVLSKSEDRYTVTNMSAPGLAFTMPVGYEPIGCVDYDEQLYILSCNGDRVELGRYGLHDGVMTYEAMHNLTTNAGTGQPFNILASTVGWTKNTQLELFARKDYDESINLYICDGLNANTVINTVHVYTDTTANPLVKGELNQFKMLDSIPQVTAEVVAGGHLRPGNYFLAFRYTTADLNSTVFMNQIGPFCVADDGKGLLDKDNIRASRSLEVTLVGPADYKYTEIAVMRYFGENGNISTEMWLLQQKFTKTGIVVIDGTEDTLDLTAEQLLMGNIEQDKCLTHIEHEGRYMGGNWVVDDQTLHGKLADLALHIVPSYVLENNDIIDSQYAALTRRYSKINSMDKMKYKAGEIYPFGVSFIIGGKHTTDVYPICGYDSNDDDALSEIVSGIHKSISYEDTERIGAVLSPTMTLNAYMIVSAGLPVLNGLEETQEPSTINCTSLGDKIAIPEGAKNIKISGRWFSGEGESDPFFTPWVIYLNVVGTVIGTLEQFDIDHNSYLEIDSIPTGTTHILVNSYTSTELGNHIAVSFYRNKEEDAYTYYKGNKGLYRFPFARKGKDADGTNRQKLFYGMMGVSINILQEAVTAMQGLDITGLVLMQGDRIVNCVSQGVVLPAVDRLLACPPRSYVSGSMERFADEVVALGDGKTRTFFPFHVEQVNDTVGTDEMVSMMNSKFMFPVHFFPGHDGNYCVAHAKAWGYVSPYFNRTAFTEAEGLTVANQKVIHVGKDKRERVFLHNRATGVLDTDTAVITGNKKIDADHFAFISPDDMGNGLGSVSGTLRTLYKRKKPDSQHDYNVKTPVATYQPNDLCTNKYDHYFLYALKENEYTDKSLFADANILGEDSTLRFVPENLATPDDKGYTSRMKSLFEVFGDLTTEGNDGAWFADNVSGKTRAELKAAGVLLNRLMFDDDKQVEEAGLLFPYTGAGNIFQGWYANQNLAPTTHSLPLVMSNMSMKSCPYYAFESLSKVNVNTGYSDCITERYNYDPDALDVYQHFLDRFNINGETYHPIHTMDKPVTSSTINLYKGDVFAQIVTFRLNRYNYEVKDNAQAAQYRHGQVAQVYLECFKNHDLRTVKDDDMFWPYASTVGHELLDYAYAGTDERLRNESRSFNEGNHELQGLLRKYGVDTDLPQLDGNKPGRVYYSGKYIDGAYEDAYRLIPVGQYQDFGNQYGAIQKLLSAFGELFCIFEHGIVQMYTNNKVQSIGDSSEYILGQTELLYDQTKFLFNCGTQHRNSIAEGNFGFYCVDWLMNKISYTSYHVTEMGSTTFITEDLCLTKNLLLFFPELRKRIADGQLVDIVSGYLADSGEVYFTFLWKDGQGVDQFETLVYNEQQGAFTGYVDYDARHYMRFNDLVLLYQGGKVWRPEAGVKYNDFFDKGVQDSNPFTITFYVNGMSEKNNLSNIEKEYIINHIFASDNMFKVNGGYTRNIIWETTYQQSSTDINADAGAFWKTPEFLEHMWHLPIDVQSSPAAGPSGSTAFNTFDEGASLRGPWLKVTITYTGTERIVLKNVTTDFNISKS